jgi:hypothetical protein
MKEWTQESLDHCRYNIANGLGSAWYRGLAERYQEDLDWYATDEVRPCWTVENLFDRPVIYVRQGDWDEFVSELDDDLQGLVTVIEGTITGHEAGALGYYDL